MKTNASYETITEALEKGWYFTAEMLLALAAGGIEDKAAPFSVLMGLYCLEIYEKELPFTAWSIREDDL